jgi:hypothetical protein
MNTYKKIVGICIFFMCTLFVTSGYAASSDSQSATTTATVNPIILSTGFNSTLAIGSIEANSTGNTISDDFCVYSNYSGSDYAASSTLISSSINAASTIAAADSVFAGKFFKASMTANKLVRVAAIPNDNTNTVDKDVADYTVDFKTLALGFPDDTDCALENYQLLITLDDSDLKGVVEGAYSTVIDITFSQAI